MSSLSPAIAGRRVMAMPRWAWWSYAFLVAVLIATYIVLGPLPYVGVDYACFRSAALLIMHGGNPYDLHQLWTMQNMLYNLPGHVAKGTAQYYDLDRFYNPPLFLLPIMALTRLPYATGFVLYSAAVIALAMAGTWLVLRALGWTARTTPIFLIMLTSPCVFLAVRNGQQSTLLLCALGAALLAWRRGRPGLAGALLALCWVKPHLLVPFALTAPLLLPDWRDARRWYAGFLAATGIGVFLTIVTTGAASIGEWLHGLFGYTGYADAVNNFMPSVSGMGLVLLTHPWNRLFVAALLVVAVAAMAGTILWARRRSASPIAAMGVLVALWLVCSPYAHTNDDVLLLLPLAVAWGQNGARMGRALPLAALWAFSALSMAFIVPRPLNIVGVLPAALALWAALHALRRTSASRSTEAQSVESSAA